LYDKKKNIGAIAHGGWRGTAEKIGAKTVLKMVSDFGCKSENITALIGPCISECCFEVGGEVLNKLNESIGNNERISEDEKTFADLKQINKIQLEQVGVKDIDIAPYCTVCNNDMFFSYRNENGTSNRHSAVLKIK
jgi:YfiH family protein